MSGAPSSSSEAGPVAPPAANLAAALQSALTQTLTEQLGLQVDTSAGKPGPLPAVPRGRARPLSHLSLRVSMHVCTCTLVA